MKDEWWLYHWPTRTLIQSCGPVDDFRKAQLLIVEALHFEYWAVYCYNDRKFTLFELEDRGENIGTFNTLTGEFV